jgi:hypothetical protein
MLARSNRRTSTASAVRFVGAAKTTTLQHPDGRHRRRADLLLRGVEQRQPTRLHNSSQNRPLNDSIASLSLVEPA